MLRTPSKLSANPKQMNLLLHWVAVDMQAPDAFMQPWRAHSSSNSLSGAEILADQMPTRPLVIASGHTPHVRCRHAYDLDCKIEELIMQCTLIMPALQGRCASYVD